MTGRGGGVFGSEEWSSHQRWTFQATQNRVDSDEFATDIANLSGTRCAPFFLSFTFMRGSLLCCGGCRGEMNAVWRAYRRNRKYTTNTIESEARSCQWDAPGTNLGDEIVGRRSEMGDPAGRNWNSAGRLPAVRVPMDNKGDRLMVGPPLPPAVDALLRAATTLIPSTPSLLASPPSRPSSSQQRTPLGVSWQPFPLQIESLTTHHSTDLATLCRLLHLRPSLPQSKQVIAVRLSFTRDWPLSPPPHHLSSTSPRHLLSSA